jgi:large subunit ribosomal protein L13
MKENQINTKINFLLFDATEKILGRFTSNIAGHLMGKKSIEYARNKFIKNFIIIINSDKIKVTGNKFNKKLYYRHSEYPGGLKTNSYKDIFKNDSRKIIYMAIKGMLPKNKLRKKMLKNLRIFTGNNHTHIAQNPIKLN